MNKLIMATALTALMISPALAQAQNTRSGEAMQSRAAADKPVKKKTTISQRRPPAAPYSPYAHHPSYDVYVNGEYVGSDPDPRVRESLRREWIGEGFHGLR